MKRLLKVLARLYPSDWRKRYGVEYDALLEQGTPRARDAFDVVRAAVEMHATNWSLVKVVLPCAICGALLAAAISFAISPQYASRAVIRVTVNDEVARSKGDAVALSTALAPLFRDALSETSLATMIQKLDLYPRERVRMSQEAVIDRMRKNVRVMPVTKGPGQDAVILQFSYPDPHTAQKVDRELTSAVLTSSLHMSENHSPTFPAEYETFRIETDASLPAPLYPKRGVFGAGGLVAGIAGGLLTVFMRRRRQTAAAS